MPVLAQLFRGLFNQCIDNSDTAAAPQATQISMTAHYFVCVLSITFSSRHKLLFSLLVCTCIMRVMTVQEKIDEANVGDAEESDEEDEDEDAKPKTPRPSVPAVIRPASGASFFKTSLNYEAQPRLWSGSWTLSGKRVLPHPQRSHRIHRGYGGQVIEFEAWAESDSPFQNRARRLGRQLTYFID